MIYYQYWALFIYKYGELYIYIYIYMCVCVCVCVCVRVCVCVCVLIFVWDRVLDIIYDLNFFFHKEYPMSLFCFKNVYSKNVSKKQQQVVF